MNEPEKQVVVERIVVVCNKEGLHFRPIMKLVDVASKFSATGTVQHEDRVASTRSPMELLMLVAPFGAKLKLTAEGADAQQEIDALAALVESGFNET